VAPQLLPFSFGEGSLTSGQPITVQCMIVDGDLPMTLRWMFHGKELSSQMGISTFRLNPRVSLLSIDSVAAGHAGDYTCTAQNAAGQSNHTASLFVNGVLAILQSLNNSCLLFRRIPYYYPTAPCRHYLIRFLSWSSSAANYAVQFRRRFVDIRSTRSYPVYCFGGRPSVDIALGLSRPGIILPDGYIHHQSGR
jgi:hypothetical protein